MSALARWDWLKFRAAHAPRGERTKRAAELRDETRRLLGYPRALRNVQRKRRAA